MDLQTVDYYSRNADAIGDRYESIVSSLAAHFERAFSPDARILDIGCGSGRDMAHLCAMGRQVFGTDATPELVRLAQRLHPELVDRIVCAALPRAPVPFGGGFDGVLCSAVLMHVAIDDQPAAVDFIKRCLRADGTLLYSVPSKRLDVHEKSQRDPAGRLFVSDGQGRLQNLFETAGFSLIDQWSNSDSLGRDEVEWTSVLMCLSSR